MTPGEQAARDVYWESDPNEFYRNTYKDDEDEEKQIVDKVDDKGTVIDKNDFVFIAYVVDKEFEGEYTYSISYRKHVLQHENFLDLLTEIKKENKKIDMSKTVYMSGEEWLANV